MSQRSLIRQFRLRAFGDLSPAVRPSDGLPARAGDTSAARLERGGAVADSELSPRQWCILLLHAAAEIEHALLAQYLFALYSLPKGIDIPNSNRKTDDWRIDLRLIAQEEMGHLLTVQNWLRALGGPLHFERDSFPIRNRFYPFRFELERFSLSSLAKYVAAEMPDPATVPEAILSRRQLRDILRMTGGHVNRVGILYQSLLGALTVLDPQLLRPDRDEWQEIAGPWRSSDDPTGDLIGPRVFSATSIDGPTEMLKTIIDGTKFIADQGESPDTALTDSHFERFATIYREFEAAGSGFDPAFDIAPNPNTTDDPDPTDVLSEDERQAELILVKGRIRQGITRLWAHLANLRYRVLLTAVAHSCTSGPLEFKLDGVDTLVRDKLRAWAFDEMNGAGGLSEMATELAQMPLGGPFPFTAGLPFELPYSLNLPDRNPERWHLHLDLINASADLIGRIRNESTPTAKQKQILKAILDRDGRSDTTGRRSVIAQWTTHDV